MMTFKLLLHAGAQQDDWRLALTDALPDAEILDQTASPVALADACYALLWAPPPNLLRHTPNLIAIFTLGAGVDGVLSDPDLSPDVSVIRLLDAGMAQQMVDYVLYATLHFARNFDQYTHDQAALRWQPRPTRPNHAVSVGVMGLGVMGGAVARALVQRGFSVSGWSRTPRILPTIKTYAGDEQLATFLSATEILVSLLPQTPSTTGLLTGDRLSLLPAGAALINAGRGSLVVEADLLAALNRGHLRGAFLDVTAEEPLPAASPLWAHPRVRITPHIAANTRIEHALPQILENIRRIEYGEAPDGEVDRARGY